MNHFGDDIAYHPFLTDRILYSFKSTRTHHTYWAIVEQFDNEVFAIKFHLKDHRNSDNKYSILTNLNEARPVINTCIKIMLEIMESHPEASFGFIGVNSENEETYFTRRFEIYTKFMATYFSNERFVHYAMVSKSAYLLVPRSKLDKDANFVEKLTYKFKEYYPYFE